MTLENGNFCGPSWSSCEGCLEDSSTKSIQFSKMELATSLFLNYFDVEVSIQISKILLKQDFHVLAFVDWFRKWMNFQSSEGKATRVPRKFSCSSISWPVPWWEMTSRAGKAWEQEYRGVTIWSCEIVRGYARVAHSTIRFDSCSYNVTVGVFIIATWQNVNGQRTLDDYLGEQSKNFVGQNFSVTTHQCRKRITLWWNDRRQELTDRNWGPLAKSDWSELRSMYQDSSYRRWNGRSKVILYCISLQNTKISPYRISNARYYVRTF